MNRGLDGGRARCGDHDVGRGEHRVGLRLDDPRRRVRAAQGLERVEKWVGQIGGAGDHELHRRNSIAHLPGRRDHVGQDPAQLVGAAAGEHCHHRRPRIELVPAAERLPVFAGRSQVEQRVPDERDGDPRVAVQPRLEREDDESPGHEAPHGPEPAAPPRPRLRADVVDDGDAEGRDGGADPEVDLGKVDGHEDVGAFRPRRPHEAAVGPPGVRQHRQRLGQSGGGEPGVVGGEAPSRRRELSSSEPEDLRARAQPADLARQGARVQVARRLAAREHHPGRRHVGCSGAGGRRPVAPDQSPRPPMWRWTAAKLAGGRRLVASGHHHGPAAVEARAAGPGTRRKEPCRPRFRRRLLNLPMLGDARGCDSTPRWC